MNRLGNPVERITARLRRRLRGATGVRTDLDDQALARHMRQLAVRIKPDGRAPLRLPQGLERAVRRIGRESVRLLAQSGSPTAALERLSEDARLIEACARQAWLETTAPRQGRRLPAEDDCPRILQVARGLLAAGDTCLTEERFLLAVASFDDVQALTMAELWSAGTALRVAITESFAGVAESILAAARERLAAEQWVELQGPTEALKGRAPAFFERALQLTGELELPELRTRLAAWLDRDGLSPAQCVTAAHEAQALDQMRLDNLSAAKRMLDALDGPRSFALLSRTEAKLGRDPIGVYPAMDEASRAAVRAEVEVFARRLRLGETTVARHAVRAADEARAAHGDGDVRATVCWWLYDDAGRAELLRRLGGARHALPRLVPDPKGHGLIAALTGLTLLLWAGFAVAAGLPALLLGLPLAWYAAGLLVGRLFPLLRKPRPLLKLEIERVGDDQRTLVVIPALLSSAARAEALGDQLETLGCLERDANIDFLLLGDFRDGDASRAADDEAIVRAARTRIAALNQKAGREKYAYLHRPRVYYPRDGRWMGRERKRGALMALNRLLLNEPGAADAFTAEGAACARLAARRYAYVLTLDADTAMLPGTARRLIGALAHPLNRPHALDGRPRGYAILQPNMELRASACANRFIALLAGRGGMDSYPVSVSNLHQDLTGLGIFGGKGIYDLAAFQAALDGTLPEGQILSHDLLEGLLARAGFVADISLYDGFPAALPGYVKRLERWTRGDWQLLPFLFGRGLPKACRLRALDRLKLLDNLLRSLAMPALLALFICAAWLENGAALALGIILILLPCLVALPRLRGVDLLRAAARLAALPVLAAAQFGAAVRAVWRLAISKKHLLDWVTAADAEHARGGNLTTAGRVAALLLVPGLFSARLTLPSLALGAAFLIGPYWLRRLAATPVERRVALTLRQVGALSELARETWAFFERYVTEAEHGLPPDNVQIDPPVGAARRTSPTNIGLYLVSALAAARLGFIRADELQTRLQQTVATLERLEKWHGQLYNWYDINTLAPLKPRYVSAVDSGNLAACLLLTAQALGNDPLATRLRNLATGMDFAPLFDPARKLFFIGVDVEADRPSAAHYDLLASESRILSYVAMMLGQIPLVHWRKLARPVAPIGGGQALISWSGTMFEYLMPELFLRAPVGTLLHTSNRAVVAAQRTAGAALRRPWGVSESGYYAFDMNLNYQYRAFGVQALALGGAAAPRVVAPYASLLALAVDPAAAADNALAMRVLGWTGDCGFYEAADYGVDGEQDAPRLVASYMAHHQGMALCALCNALTDDSLARCFAAIPEARALSLLLEEKPAARLRLGRRKPLLDPEPQKRRLEQHLSRRGDPAGRLADTHILCGAGATAFLTARGDLMYTRHGVLANAFSGDFLRRSEGIFLHARLDGGPARVFGDAETQVLFDAGWAAWTLRLGAVSLRLTACVSPEDGALFQHVEARNEGDRPARLALTDCFAVALAAEADFRAHPAFQKLSVESRRAGRAALQFTRRPRNPGENNPVLLHLASGGAPLGWETDLDRLLGRSGDLSAPLDTPCGPNGALGSVLNPCSALSIGLDLTPGEARRVHFAVGLAAPEAALAWLDRNAQESAPERAKQLAETQARAMLGFLGLNAEQHRLLQRAAALLVDPHLATPAGDAAEPAAHWRQALWALGISGDLPIVCLAVASADGLERAREAVRLHEFYRTLGLWLDLVLINDYGSAYDQPLREGLRDLIAASHLRELVGARGGVHLLEGSALSGEQRALLRRAAALNFTDGESLYAQLRRRLQSLAAPKCPACLPMRAEASGKEPHPANGFGAFTEDGRAYRIHLRPGRETPAAWSNILASDSFGMLVTERGGGFLWRENSRNGRLTPFDNDARREGWGLMLYLTDAASREYVTLLPGPRLQSAWTVTHGEGFSRFERRAGELDFSTELYVLPDENALAVELRVHNRADAPRALILTAFVDWLLGVDGPDARRVRSWRAEGICLAAGTMLGVGYLAAPGEETEAGFARDRFLGLGGIACPDGLLAPPEPGGHALRLPLSVDAGATRIIRLRLGWAESAAAAVRQARLPVPPRRPERRFDALRFETPDPALNALANHFLSRQVLDARVLARAGLYQASGAYGFRDQLQDMLALLPYDPARVRVHLLTCAARQFPAGDVLHWWHMPRTGVRTRISDDLLFLPYVCAAYVRETGDAGVLAESVPFLEEVELPENREDVYAEMRASNVCATLHEHCMRAFRRAARTGAHGLALMGAGDWNDGLNRVGAAGQGESVWLSEFLSACAADYAEISPSEEDRAWLTALSAQMNAAIEEFGWDGAWYRRAYDDTGAPLGSRENRECRIDLIAQAWAVLAGLDARRCAVAMDSAWRQLADPEARLIKLLTPPFDGETDPGYIRGYPPGVRENGGQYTHAACWYLLALIRQGDAARAHQTLRMLLPTNHTQTEADVKRYRVEPYALAADIYGEPPHTGRGGWTWYTGAAGWLLRTLLALLGYERRGDRVRLEALLGDWPEAGLRLQCGGSVYRLVCRRDAEGILLDGTPVAERYIRLIDDGQAHEAVFPPRRANAAEITASSERLARPAE